MTKQIKKLSCEECESNDLEFSVFVDEFGEPTSDVQEQIRTGNIEIDAEDYLNDIEPRQKAWCNTCEMWQGINDYDN